MDRDEFESKVLELWTKSRVSLTKANLQYTCGVSPRMLSKWIDDLQGRGVLTIDPDEREQRTYLVSEADRPVDGPTTCEEYERKRQLIEEAKRRILARRSANDKAARALGTQVRKDDVRKDDVRKEEDRATAQVPDDEDDPDYLDDADDLDAQSSAARNIAGLMGKAALLASTTALVTLDKPLAMLDKPRAKGEKSLLASAGLSLFGPIGWLYAGSFREAVPATLAQVAILAVVPSFLYAPFMLIGALGSAAVGAGYAWRFNRKKGRTPLFLRARNKAKKKSK